MTAEPNEAPRPVETGARSLWLVCVVLCAVGVGAWAGPRVKPLWWYPAILGIVVGSACGWVSRGLAAPVEGRQLVWVAVCAAGCLLGTLAWSAQRESQRERQELTGLAAQLMSAYEETHGREAAAAVGWRRRWAEWREYQARRYGAAGSTADWALVGEACLAMGLAGVACKLTGGRRVRESRS